MEKVSINRQKKYAKAQTKAQLKTAHLASCEGRNSKNTSRVLRSHSSAAEMLGSSSPKCEGRNSKNTSRVLRSHSSAAELLGSFSAKSVKLSHSPAANHNSEQKSAEENLDSIDMNVKDSEKPSNINPRRTLTEAERNKLISLESSFIAHFLNGETSNENPEEIPGLFNRAMLTVQKLVRFMKTVSEFRDLTVEDQTACLKANLVGCLIMIATGHYDVSQESFHVQGIYVGADMLRGLLQSHLDVVEKLIELSTVIQVECKPDFQLQAVLQCLMVFNPETEELKHRLLLSNYQDNYLILLKHYLEERFSLREGKRLFIFLLQKLQDVKPMAFSFTEIANEVGPDKVQPLVVEVFNIEKKTDTSHQ